MLTKMSNILTPLATPACTVLQSTWVTKGTDNCDVHSRGVMSPVVLSSKTNQASTQ